MAGLNRRIFLQNLMGVGTLSLTGFSLRGGNLTNLGARSPRYDGPLLLTILANGGWDPAFFCEPTGKSENNHLASTIASAGNIQYAPVPLEVGMDNLNAEDVAGLLSNKQFFERHHQRMTSISGVKVDTITHVAGKRQMWSGNTRDSADFPCLAALFAGVHGPDLPLSFMSTGSPEDTADIIPLTRFGGLSGINSIARPHEIGSAEYESAWLRERVEEAVVRDLEHAIDTAQWQGDRRQAERYAEARHASTQLSELQVPDLETAPVARIKREIEAVRVISEAFAQGYAAAGNLSIGGFDNHSDLDSIQPASLAKVWTVVDFAFEEAKRLGLEDRLVVVVGSDFGRPLTYADNDTGKNHHPVSSMLVLSDRLPGDRQIGGRDAEGMGLALDPSSLQPSASGVVPEIATVHRSLRRMLGLSEHALCKDAFPLPGDDLDLFPT